MLTPGTGFWERSHNRPGQIDSHQRFGSLPFGRYFYHCGKRDVKLFLEIQQSVNEFN
jgi:hypothetical protein